MDKSLLRGERVSFNGDGEDEPRFTMLETVREYGLERLKESGEEEETRRRHADYFLSTAEEGELGLRGPRQKLWLGRLELEHDNIRAALEWSINGGEIDVGVRLAGTMWWFWYIAGYRSEGGRWLESVLQKGRSASASARLKALLYLGGTQSRGGNFVKEIELGEESLELARELGSQEDIAFALGLVGMGKCGLGEYDEGMKLIEESMTLARELDDKWVTASLLNIPAIIALNTGDYGRAKKFLEESLTLFRELENDWSIANSLKTLGSVMLYEGDYDRAKGLLEEALTLFRGMGSKGSITETILLLGRVALQQGEYDRARQSLEESYSLSHELEEGRNIAGSLRILAGVEYAQEDHSRALGLYRESITHSREVKDEGGIVGCLEGTAQVIGSQGGAELAAHLYGAAEAWREVGIELRRAQP